MFCSFQLEILFTVRCISRVFTFFDAVEMLCLKIFIFQLFDVAAMATI